MSGSDERQGERIDEAVPALSIDAIDEAPPAADPEGARLDPVDQQAFRATAHALLDTCLDRLENARELPWQPPPDALPGDLHGLPEPVPRSGVPLAQISRELGESVMPYATGNTHPRFFGWVHGTGLADGLLSDMVAATMNANCGGRRHIGIDIERRVIDWCASMHGLPETAGGLITSGTSMATLLALQAARVQRFGQALRTEGQREPAVLYAAAGTHQCVARAAELLGLGREAVRTLPLDRANGSACLKTLSRLVAEDRAAGRVPLCLVGTAGSVDTGRFDDLAALADAAAEHEVWFHVDGAFGAWAVIAEQPWRALANGLERADSMAFDFHKWPYVGYSAGAVLVRDGATLGAAFSGTAAYLESDEDDALAAGAPWPCDLGPALSRGFLALKVWTALRRHGIEALGAAISDNCRQAALLAERVEATPQPRPAASRCTPASPPERRSAASSSASAATSLVPRSPRIVFRSPAAAMFATTSKAPGATAPLTLVLEPLDFIARLAALVPKPRVNLTRFHGVFAPNSRYRARVTSAGRGPGARCAAAVEAEHSEASSEPEQRTRRAAIGCTRRA